MVKFPIFIAACCISLYWVTVVVKSIRLARKIGKDPNVIPRERTGQFTRLLWAPVICLWIFTLWRGTFLEFSSIISIPSFVQYGATFLVIMATWLTFLCWRQMGHSWRIGIDPQEKTQLIVTGLYEYLQHPIYSLSIVLGLMTFIILPTSFMLFLVTTHIFLLILEARREENYLRQVHGQCYRNYQESVGRFIPKSFQVRKVLEQSHGRNSRGNKA